MTDKPVFPLHTHEAWEALLAENERLRAAGKALTSYPIVYDEMYDLWKCEACNVFDQDYESIDHDDDCPTLVFMESEE